MTAADLLSTLRARGVEVQAHDGRLRWRPREAVTLEERDLLARHKAELLAILAAPAAPLPPARPSKPSKPSAASWDPAEAERLLQGLRAALARVEADVAAGLAPAARAAAVRTWLEVGEGFVNDHEREAARGWDALALLRGAVAEALKAAQRALPAGDGPGKDGAAIPDDLEALRSRAEKAEYERGEFKELLQRTQADLANYQKRINRELAQERRYAHSPLAADLLPALDNLERATAAAAQAGETGPLVQGVAMVQAQLLDVLKRHGVTRIEAQGQPFDLNRHQAVMQKPTAEAPPNTAVQVLEPGYTIHERVLRPAGVVVSTPAAGPPRGPATVPYRTVRGE
jgi:molecular chaperone GrpE